MSRAGGIEVHAKTRIRVIELLAAGASRRHAARAAGIGHQTLLRWLKRGESASEGSRWAEFRMDVLQAEAQPRIRALKTVHDALPDYPEFAWKILERREPGFAPQNKSIASDLLPDEDAGPLKITVKLPPPGREGEESALELKPSVAPGRGQSPKEER